MELCELLVTIKLNELERAADRGELVLEALSPPPKPRKPTKPSRGAKERRLSEKARHSQKKQFRRGAADD